MPSGIINRIVILASTNTTRLASERTVCSEVTIGCPPSNSAVVNFVSDNSGPDDPWKAGKWITYHDIDLQPIVVQGSAGDAIEINGTF